MKIYLFLSLFISSFRSQKVSGSEVVLLRLLLGKALFTHLLGNLLYDLLKAAFLGAWRAGTALPRLLVREVWHGGRQRPRRRRGRTRWEERRRHAPWERR